jgi:TolB protein
MKTVSRVLRYVLVTAALAATVPAYATFGGKNGRIVFYQGSGAQADIYTMNSDGSDVEQLTFFALSGGTAYAGSWSPDGRRIVFVGAASAANGPFQLWIMNSDGSSQHLLLDDPAYFYGVPSFSPDGGWIVFARCGLNCAIYRINADGHGLTALTHFNSNPDINDWEPVYSPDGKTIAFTSLWRDGLIEAIYLMNSDGSGLRSLSPPSLGTLGGDWSPDGESLVFYSYDPFEGDGSFPLSSELWTIDAGNGKTTRLTFNNQHWYGVNSVPHDLWPSWSPQGDAIVFERDAPDFSSSALYIMNPDGSNLKQVLQLPARQVTSALKRRNFVGSKWTRLGITRIEQGGSFPRWGAAPQGTQQSRAH